MPPSLFPRVTASPMARPLTPHWGILDRGCTPDHAPSQVSVLAFFLPEPMNGVFLEKVCLTGAEHQRETQVTGSSECQATTGKENSRGFQQSLPEAITRRSSGKGYLCPSQHPLTFLSKRYPVASATTGASASHLPRGLITRAVALLSPGGVSTRAVAPPAPPGVNI